MASHCPIIVVIVIVVLLHRSTPFYKSFGRSEEEDKLGEEVLLKFQLFALSHQVNIQAQLKQRNRILINTIISYISRWKHVSDMDQINCGFTIVNIIYTPFNKWFWTILYLLPTKWSILYWNKLLINETVPILLWQTSVHSFRYCSNNGEVFIVSNAVWMSQTNRRLFKPIC